MASFVAFAFYGRQLKPNFLSKYLVTCSFIHSFIYLCIYIFIYLVSLIVSQLFGQLVVNLFVKTSKDPKTLQLKKRTSTSTRFNLKFLRVFLKEQTCTPWKASFYFFSPKKLVRLIAPAGISPSRGGTLVTRAYIKESTYS